jgi:hypothetical protein
VREQLPRENVREKPGPVMRGFRFLKDEKKEKEVRGWKIFFLPPPFLSLFLSFALSLSHS